MRDEAPKLVDNTYQQLLSNKDWVKQLNVIAVTISFEQWLRVGVQKYVDATFRKFGDAEALRKFTKIHLRMVTSPFTCSGN